MESSAMKKIEVQGMIQAKSFMGEYLKTQSSHAKIQRKNKETDSISHFMHKNNHKVG